MNINQSEAEILDAEELHLQIITSVESGEYDSCIEALTEFAEKHDIDPEDLKCYISQTLKDILYVESCKLGYIKEPNISNAFDGL